MFVQMHEGRVAEKNAVAVSQPTAYPVTDPSTFAENILVHQGTPLKSTIWGTDFYTHFGICSDTVFLFQGADEATFNLF